MKKILHVALEYKKGVGGLKSVTNGLLPSLASKNKLHVSIITPYFKFFKADDLIDITRIAKINHIHQEAIYTSDVFLCRDYTEDGVVNHYLIKPEINSPVAMIFDINDEKDIYQAYDHSEPLYRLSYFNSAVASFVRLPQSDKIPEFDIVHTHAWHTALAACLIKEYESLSLISVVSSVAPNASLRKMPYIVNTIHILSEIEHGLLLRRDLQLLLKSVGLPKNFESKFNDFNHHVNSEAAKQIVIGLLYSDQVTIVSTGLVKDVLNGKGCGIDDIFKKLKTENRLLGINNGIYFKHWDATSNELLKEYSLNPEMPSKGKLNLKLKLVTSFKKLSSDKKWFLFVGRFSEEKGVDMLKHALKAVQDINANFIIMGIYTVGDDCRGINYIKNLINSFKNIENVLVIDDLNIQIEFGMQIRAASDFTIVPSHVEACGLVPMEAMACASIPITSDVQGLPDCVLKLDEDILNGTGFTYMDDPTTRNDGIKSVILQANQLHNKLLDSNQLDELLTRILKHSKSFDWKQSAADTYISMYENIPSKPLVLVRYKKMQNQVSPKPSDNLRSFLITNYFDSLSFNKVNKYNVTALTLAIDKNMLDISQELLNLGANPILPNCHGYNPMSFSKTRTILFNNLLFNNALLNAIKNITIPELTDDNNQIIVIQGRSYNVEKIIKTCTSSLGVFILACQLSSEKFIFKIKMKFDGFEIRNHILCDQFRDLLNIDLYIIENDLIFKNVQGLLQPLVPGVSLSDYFIQHPNNQNQIDRLIEMAITALNKLQIDKNCVHRNAIPTNAFYNNITDTITFIDIDILRIRSDHLKEKFEFERINDFKQLLLGDKKNIKGLKEFSKNILHIISKIADQNIQAICKTIISLPDVESPFFYKNIQSQKPLKPSDALCEFLINYGFDLSNINKVNKYNVTALTLAIDKNMLAISQELLDFGANPILANCHGNRPMSFSKSRPNLFNNSLFVYSLWNAIKSSTIPKISEENNQIIEIRGSRYKVERVIKGGSCSLSVLELRCQSSKKQFILKINSKFGGLEIRNHIFLDVFNDLLNIDIFIKDDGKIIIGVQGLLQLLVPGVSLNDYYIQHFDNQEQIDRVIGLAITAMNKLHVDKNCVHKDALPGNALYNSITDTVAFIDLLTLSLKSDPGMKDFELEKYNDFKRLLLGDGNKAKGLKHFSKNMQLIISKLTDQNIWAICNKILGLHDAEPQMFHESNNLIRVLHVALEYGQAVLGGLGMVTTQMVKAQNTFLNSNRNSSVAEVITPFYPKLYTERNFIKIAAIEHLFDYKIVTSNILYFSQNKHYMIEPTGDLVDLFNISTVHGIYNNDEGSTFINKVLYFNSAVSAYIAQSETLKHHPRPQIIQLHDWMVALIPVLLNEVHKYNKTSSLFVVHIDNLDHGAYMHDSLQGVGLDFKPGEHMLKAIGVKNSDMIVTVSPGLLQECLNSISKNHNVEIMRRLFVIAKAKNQVMGIANGFIYTQYCPIGVLIADKSNIFLDKLRIKTELAKHLNGSRSVWNINPNLPLILYIGRYSSEKGVETFKQLIDTVNTQAIFIAIGRGFEPHVFDVVNDYSRQSNNIYVTFSELEQKEYLPLARAGAEFMFVPSHREADGLVIKEGFANGCIAITSGVGGLKDSAVTFDSKDPDNTSGNSFIYEDFNNPSLTKNIKQALLMWSNLDPGQKSKVHLRIMDEAKKHDWTGSEGPLKKYNDVYGDMIIHKNARLKNLL